MSAELLRDAATLMRERAEVCVDGWGMKHTPESWRETYEVGVDYDQDAPHIASWHPAVALAVADWLEDVAIMGRCDDCSYSAETCSLAKATGSIACCPDCQHPSRRALTVARVYLGRDA